VGAALLVVAAIVGGGLLMTTVLGFLRTDVSVAADGEPHRVSVEVDGDRFLWVREGVGGDCSVRDEVTRREIDLRPVEGSYTRTVNGVGWVAEARFDPGSGQLVVTCTGSLGWVQIGPATSIGSFVAGILGAILIPLVLAGAGLTVLLVTGILYLTRPARPRGP
jgi:hypothetical protein